MFSGGFVGSREVSQVFEKFRRFSRSFTGFLGSYVFGDANILSGGQIRVPAKPVNAITFISSPRVFAETRWPLQIYSMECEGHDFEFC